MPLAPFVSWHAPFVVCLTCFTFRVLDRFFLHPLRGFPGPRACAISSWFMAFYEVLWPEAVPERLRRMHDRYGPVVRIGPNELHFCDPQAYTSIYVEGAQYADDPGFYDAFRTAEESLKLDRHPAWKPHKRALSQAFESRVGRDLDFVIQQKVDEMISRLRQDAGSPEVGDLHEALRVLALDVASSPTLPRHAHTSGNHNIRHVDRTSLASNFGRVRRHLPARANRLDGALCQVLLRALHALHMLFDSWSPWVNGYSVTLHQTLCGSLPEKNALAPSQETCPLLSLADDIQMMMATGNLMVATVCSVAVHHVLRDPAVHAALLSELESAWPRVSSAHSHSQSRPALGDLEQLPYLTAVIKEALRLSPPFAEPLKRVAPFDTEIAGYCIPEGTVVSVSADLLHQNAEIFPEPQRFDPERWLDRHSGYINNYLVPFSKGPGKCLGESFARCEMYFILANVFWRLDIRQHEDQCTSV